MRYSAEQYNQKFEMLTDKQKAFIESEDTDAILASIAAYYKLDMSKWRLFSGEIVYVLLNLQPKIKFIANLKQFVGLENITAESVSDQVQKKIFIPWEDLNLPATAAEAPEREVTLRKIVTPNPILNKQLEVPVVHPLEEKPQQPAMSRPQINQPPLQPRKLTPVSEKESTTPPRGLGTPPNLGGDKEEVRTSDGPSILGARMGGSFGLPKEDINIAPNQSKQAPAPANLPTQAPKKDPYREPLE